ncbi:hypothetical protein C0583_07005 [Candidatus Parcubacteria bacterium]|nr:MAG: hypothetical protein C0583_07005 [Candidatus Parcubacteria bacterium]
MEKIKIEQNPQEELNSKEEELEKFLKFRNSSLDARHSNDAKIIKEKEAEIKKLKNELGLDVQEEMNKKKELIANSKNFEDLYKTLEHIKSIEGSKEAFSSDRLITIIEKIRHKQLPLNNITRNLELRNKVTELIKNEEEDKTIRSSPIKKTGTIEKIKSFFNL